MDPSTAHDAPDPGPPPTRPPPRVGMVPEYFQLVQAAVYHADGLWGEATFDLYVKEAPPGWGFMIAAGVEAAIDALLDTTVAPDTLSWLKRQPQFAQVGPVFFEELADLRFDGDVFAVPEGTVVFPGEPILRLTAPLPWAGLYEAGLIQIISQATGVATRAARLVLAARGRPVLDFGSRRAAGPDAAWQATRAAWIGGIAGTTNSVAAATLGIPVVGVASDTMIAAYGDRDAALSALRQHAPAACELNLPDEPVRDALDRLSVAGEDLRTVRVDADDLVGRITALRALLDARGLQRARIMGSGGLDDITVVQLVRAGTPVDEIGVGGWLSAGRPPPTSYRIAELVRGLDREPITGAWSAPWPGRKQILRMADHDLLCDEVEAKALAIDGAAPLLQPFVVGGERRRPPEALVDIRARRAEQIAALPAGVRRLDAPDAWPVVPSRHLRHLAG